MLSRNERGFFLLDTLLALFAILAICSMFLPIISQLQLSKSQVETSYRMKQLLYEYLLNHEGAIVEGVFPQSDAVIEVKRHSSMVEAMEVCVYVETKQITCDLYY